MEDEDDIESFDSDEEMEYTKKAISNNLARKPAAKPLPKSNVGLSGRKDVKAEIRKPIREVEPEEIEAEEEPKPEVKEEAEPRYIAVPRAVPMETMLNEIYDSQQRIEQALMWKN